MAVPTSTIVNIGGLNAYTANYSGGGIRYIVETPIGVIYVLYINNDQDIAYKKSVDYGMSFSADVVLKAISCTQFAVWYDRWTDPTGVLGDLIHVVYTDSGADDVFYRTIDTASSDTLGTERTVFAGGTTAAGGAISISRTRGGNLICCGCIDAGTEVFSRKSTDVGVNWSDIAAVYEAGGNADLCICMPGWDADSQDAMIFYYDRSGTEVSVKYFDDSANSVSEASLATSVSLPDHTSATLGHISATVDHTNSANLCAFWTAIDTGGADILVFSCTQAAQTAKTNVITDSADDQGFCVITIAAALWYVFYGGPSDGSETYNQVNVYYKISADGGTTWGTETKISIMDFIFSVFWGMPISYRTYGYATHGSGYSAARYHPKIIIPHSTYQLGM